MKPYYEHGGIVIYHGDCRDVELPASVSLVLTDPPYGVREKTERLTRRGGPGLHGGGVKGRAFSPVAGDSEAFDPSWLLTFPKAVLWGANHYAGLPPSASWLVWDKRRGTTPDDNADCELAWTNLGGPVRIFSHLWRGVCRDSEAGQAPVHPTQKPVTLMLWCLALAKLKPGALVLDPYMGSGPALFAAYLMNYRAIGIEIEERYCEIAAKRLQQEVLPLEASA